MKYRSKRCCTWIISFFGPYLVLFLHLRSTRRLPICTFSILIKNLYKVHLFIYDPFFSINNTHVSCTNQLSFYISEEEQKISLREKYDFGTFVACVRAHTHTTFLLITIKVMFFSGTVNRNIWKNSMQNNRRCDIITMRATVSAQWMYFINRYSATGINQYAYLYDAYRGDVPVSL